MAVFGPGLGFPELILIVFVILLFIGPKRFIGVGKGLGQSIREFKGASKSDEQSEDELEEESAKDERGD